MSRLAEFLEADDRRLSIRSLTALMSMTVASGVVILMAWRDSLSAEIFATYLLAGGGIYGFGKYSDNEVKKKSIEVQAKP